MRVVIQRVKHAQVSIGGQERSHIDQGLLVLLGITHDDTPSDAEWLVQKILKMRIFDDEAGVMNRSVLDVNGAVMVVSQFTLMAATQKGNRPSYIRAARPEQAIPLYEYFIENLNQSLQTPAATGEFGADMQVSLLNDGPVTIIMDTHNKE
jgi:D-tyrosyl-tRNA(Tyr) deacylase